MNTYNLTERQMEKLSDALGYYMGGEFGYHAYDTLGEYVDENGIINIAYTEYDDGEMDYEGLPYYAIQASYDLNKREYVYGLDLGDGSEKVLTRSATIDEFVDDLCNADFEDFIRI